jgi:N-acetyl-alpha-D-glucosaminyl L-malate synthase BshA
MTRADGPLRVGIVCFSTFGGSGVIASEIALSLAQRGHRVHVFSDHLPGRLHPTQTNPLFHPVDLRAYPQFKHPPYTLALTSKIVDVARREQLDLVHTHYAIPHAASAYLARQILAAEAGPALKLVTTLHGTDITLVGADESFLPLTRFSIAASDAVTAPSAWLVEATYRNLEVPRAIRIDMVPNFVDTERFHPPPRDEGAGTRRRRRTVVHVSNFRPLKRVQDVVRIFARVRATTPALLRLVGNGPERSGAAALTHELGLADDVEFLGEGVNLPEVLRGADVFLLPSETESFGLAALEALACGVPVVASAVGGLPEVITDGEVGFLRPVGDVAAMADAVQRLLTDEGLRHAQSLAARRRAEAHFTIAPAIDRYVDIYRRVLD